MNVVVRFPDPSAIFEGMEQEQLIYLVDQIISFNNRQIHL